MPHSYVFVKAGQTNKLNEVDCTIRNLAFLFKVTSESIHLVDEAGITLFPEEGRFCHYALGVSGRTFNVMGDNVPPSSSHLSPAPVPSPPPSTSTLPSPSPGHFGFITDEEDEEAVALDGVSAKIEAVVLAADCLPAVLDRIQQVAGLRHALAPQQEAALKEAFKCCICHGLMQVPTMALCCRSLVGCQACVNQAMETSPHCIKCRSAITSDKIVTVTGLSEVLEVIRLL